MKFHFLFEQSGVFKNSAITLGHEAYDYDIVKTDDVDFQVDILTDIETFGGIMPSIFDDLENDDIVFAFFPCTYFSTISYMPLRIDWRNYRCLSDVDKFNEIRSRSLTRQRYFDCFLRLFQIALAKGFKLIVENPWTAPCFLKYNAPFKPQIVHSDRTKFGDVLRKPTAYWCLNWTPSVLDMPFHYKDSKGDIFHLAKGISRSLIDYDYALNFLSHYFGEC